MVFITSTIHGQDCSGLLKILMNKMVQTMDQHGTDFLSENHVELCHYILHHFHFHHLHSTFLVALVLANLHCVKQALRLCGGGGVVPGKELA
jgi:hypothetical protein